MYSKQSNQFGFIFCPISFKRSRPVFDLLLILFDLTWRFRLDSMLDGGNEVAQVMKNIQSGMVGQVSISPFLVNLKKKFFIRCRNAKSYHFMLSNSSNWQRSLTMGV